MPPANCLTVDRHVASLMASNRHAGAAEHALLCLCRCKVNSEVYGVGYSRAIEERVAALKDERALEDVTAAMRSTAWHKAAAADGGKCPRRPMSYLSMLGL
jgi:hypothetical protein